MYTVDCYTPTRILFGPGRLEELASARLPGKKALLCTTASTRAEAVALREHVIALLAKNSVETVLFDKATPNPTKRAVQEGAELAKETGCDFVLGLGGGSSIDCGKGIAIMMKNPGDLWDYAYAGTGGRKKATDAAPVVTVTTTCGTGTECDPFCVITNEETEEKLDFSVEATFPALSVIDPALMLSLPRSQTIYQAFDGLFHAAECYICNQSQNRLVDLYALESVRIINEALPAVLRSPDDLQARTDLAYACDILSSFTQALTSVTSHHILGQTIGGMFPAFPHGATLLTTSEAYYSAVCAFLPGPFDTLGEAMGISRCAEEPGYAFVRGLQRLMDATGCRRECLADFGVTPDDFGRIVDMTIDKVGIGLDHYVLTKADMTKILADSLKK